MLTPPFFFYFCGIFGTNIPKRTLIATRRARCTNISAKHDNPVAKIRLLRIWNKRQQRLFGFYRILFPFCRQPQTGRNANTMGVRHDPTQMENIAS